MFKNYLKIAFRNLFRQKAYAFINIFGLAIGIFCFALLLLYARYEFSFDSFHKNADRIFLLKAPDGQTSAPMGPQLCEDYPQVVNYTRFYWSGGLFSYEDKNFQESNGFFADNSIFDVFTFPLTSGDPKTALAAPFSMVVTKELVQKYFGDENPIGKTILVNQEHNFTITGVLAKMPANSFLRFDYLLSLKTADSGFFINQHKGHFGYMTFLQLAEKTRPTELEGHSKEFIGKLLGDEVTDRIFLQLEPLTRIYSHANGHHRFLYILLVIAFLILLVACINYTNLATALFDRRSREVGVRKVVGAEKKQLFVQFIGESVICALIAVALATIAVEVFLPAFSSMAKAPLHIDYKDPQILIGFFGIAILVSALAGSYPAFSLAGYNPTAIFRGKKTGKNPAQFRNMLVIGQFAVSIALIVCTFFIYSQVHFMKNKDLGFDKEQVLVVPLKDPAINKSKINILKSNLLQNADISYVTASSGVPTMINHKDPFFPEGLDNKDCSVLHTIMVDPDFIKTFGMTISAGRDFSADLTTDASGGVMINEAAAKQFGWDDPIGKKLEWVATIPSVNYTVIGVLRDFNFAPLSQHIMPVILQIVPGHAEYISVKMKTEHIAEVVAFVKAEMLELSPQYPFDFFFLDETFDNMYKSEQTLGTIMTWFSAIAIFIACLGLFGLVSFAVQNRRKEIGIRKVLGAPLPTVLRILSKDCLKWVTLANVIAWPIAFLIVTKLLQNYAYRIKITPWPFLLAGLATCALALATVSWQVVRAATTKPVQSLRYE